MKKIFSVILVLGLVGLSGFRTAPANYEQIAFEYFISDILETDFPGVTSFAFKGKTEESFSKLGNYKFCLHPEERMGSMIKDTTWGLRGNEKAITLGHHEGLTILESQYSSDHAQLFLYPSVHVADNYYVFVLFQKPKEQPAKYVVEITPEGDISRSCRMN